MKYVNVFPTQDWSLKVSIIEYLLILRNLALKIQFETFNADNLALEFSVWKLDILSAWWN